MIPHRARGQKDTALREDGQKGVRARKRRDYGREKWGKRESGERGRREWKETRGCRLAIPHRNVVM